MAPSEPTPRHDPNVAVLMTWVLPGSGHFYLGRPVFGFVAMLVVVGLYVVGYKLAGGMTFEFLDPELQGPLATALTPEVGNLGALIVHMRSQPFGPEPYMPRPWPSGIMLGSTLAALSGVLNAFLMVRSHVDARAPQPRVPESSGSPGTGRPLHPALATLLAWVVPGAGHFAQGRRLRGAIVFVLLVGLFAWGTVLSDLSNLSRERHFYFWSGQFLLGLPALATEFLSGRPPVTGDIPNDDAGLTMACIAGLLNVLAMIDVYGWAEDLWLGKDPTARRDAEDAGSAGAKAAEAEA